MAEEISIDQMKGFLDGMALGLEGGSKINPEKPRGAAGMAAERARRIKEQRAKPEAAAAGKAGPGDWGPKPPVTPKVDRETQKDFKLIAKFSGQLIAHPFTFIAMKTRHDHWKLSETECVDLGRAMERVSMRYLPYLFVEHVELGALILGTIAVFIPRIFVEMTLRKVGKREVKPEVKPEKQAQKKPGIMFPSVKVKSRPKPEKKKTEKDMQREAAGMSEEEKKIKMSGALGFGK